MNLKDTIIQFYKDLKQYDITLMELTINGMNNLRQALSKKGCLRLSQKGRIFFNHIEVSDIFINENPYKVQYDHDPFMVEDYFFRWRPAFKTITTYFKNPVGVEIGAFEGFLTDQVLKYVKPSKYYLVDPYKVYKDVIGDLSVFTQNQWDGIYKAVCQKYKNKENIEIIRKPSIEASILFENDSLDFVYIDGDHRRDAVYKDICAWYPKVKIEGIISGHDYMENTVKSGVWRFLTEKIQKNQENPEWNINFYSYENDWWFLRND
ncbi:hypothetical protein AYK26_07485 [Euryarchaeota archaeon SM23-78]|nr:MAG: hypothetical protein AYK26_07485 [Euryarchaeota archaeon SM23-78]